MANINSDDSASEVSANEPDNFDIAGAFEKLSETTEPEAEDETEEEDKTEADDGGAEDDGEGEDEAEGDEAPEGDDDAEAPDADDSVAFKHTVEGHEREYTVKQLKNLVGQEAALGQRSNELASSRKNMDAQAEAQVMLMRGLLERARAKFEPYSKIDLLAATKNPDVSAEELTAVRNAANEAYADVQYIEQDLSRFTTAIQQQQQRDLVAAAKESIRVLSNPETGITGWSEKLYGEIRSFASESGLPAEFINTLVDPSAIKLLNMARLYAKGKSKVQNTAPDLKKAPKRIVKATASSDTTSTVRKTANTASAMKRLQRSGSVDDAADAFLARWTSNDND